MTAPDRLAAATRPSWARVVRALAVVALLGILAVDCCNATGDWAWVDITKAPHMAATTGRVVATAASPQRVRDLATLPWGVGSVLALLVLLGVVVATDQPVRVTGRGIGPPRRGPPRPRLPGAPA